MVRAEWSAAQVKEHARAAGFDWDDERCQAISAVMGPMMRDLAVLRQPAGSPPPLPVQPAGSQLLALQFETGRQLPEQVAGTEQDHAQTSQALADVLEMSIAQLHSLYRDRAISPVEVTRAVLDRARAVNGQLNAFVRLLDDSALDAARAAELRFGRGEPLGLLDGVPVSVKDLYDVAGEPVSFGSPVREGYRAAADAVPVERLRQAGAVLFGQTNLLEFAYGIVHPDFGQCNNPYDPSRTAGGSSSGSAASVAAGVGYASLGTDTGGSIRIPASYCGVTGLKPTYGLVPLQGVFPLSWSLDHAGPLTRTPADAALVLDCVSGASPGLVSGDQRFCQVPLSDLTIGIIGEEPRDDLTPAVARAFDQSLEHFRSAGARVVEVSVPAVAKATAAMFATCLPEATAVHERWLHNCPGLYAGGTRLQLEMGAILPAADYARAQTWRAALQRQVDAALEQVDFLVAPTVAYPAPEEDPEFGDAEAGSGEARRTCVYNVTGHPAVSVPCGYTEAGLPIGLQLAGSRYSDVRLLEAAGAFLQAAGWNRPRPGVIGK